MNVIHYSFMCSFFVSESSLLQNGYHHVRTKYRPAIGIVLFNDKCLSRFLMHVIYILGHYLSLKPKFETMVWNQSFIWTAKNRF